MSVHDREGGFTLIELTVTVALMLVLVASILGMLSASTQVERSEQVRAQALAELRIGMQRVVKETRQSVHLDSASTRTRVDIRTLIDGAEHRVVYDIDDGTLTRAVDGGTPIPILRHLTDSSGFCFDPPTCAAAAPPPTPISMLGVSLTVAPTTRGVAPVTMSIDVHLRNARAG